MSQGRRPRRCQTHGCDRRLSSDPLVGWYPAGERFCCVDCINTADAQHSTSCDEVPQSEGSIEPPASSAIVPLRPMAALTLTLMLSPLPLVPRVLAVVLATLTALAHGAPNHFPLSNTAISGAPPTQCGLVLALAASTRLAPSRADEQRQPHLPCATIHVYGPADQFHTAHTANPAHPGFESDQPHMVYGDSTSETTVFYSAYGAEHHEPDAGAHHSAQTAQPDHGSPAALNDPTWLHFCCSH